MGNYTDIDRKSDFDYFTNHYQDLYKQYGHKFLAIRHKTILGDYESVHATIDDLSEKYKMGTYIVQECTGDESAYTAIITRLFIGE